MKINNSTKKSLLVIALAMASTTYQTQAAPIEHIGDRYIMHVPEMELTGEEYPSPTRAHWTISLLRMN